MMKRHCIRAWGLGLSLAIAIAPLALADGPMPDAKSLAMTEAILEYCAKIDPTYASDYEKRVVLVTNGANEEALAKLRKTDEYRLTHDSAVDSLAKVKEQEAKKACSQALAENR
jgi:LmbE family N-acetylglucosaminyl deacetylase